jgi:hypothetical protein
MNVDSTKKHLGKSTQKKLQCTPFVPKMTKMPSKIFNKKYP